MPPPNTRPRTPRRLLEPGYLPVRVVRHEKAKTGLAFPDSTEYILQEKPHFLFFTFPKNAKREERQLVVDLQSYIRNKEEPNKWYHTKRQKRWHKQKMYAAQTLIYALQIENAEQRKLALSYIMSTLAEMGEGYAAATTDGRMKQFYDRAMDTVSPMKPSEKRYFGSALAWRYCTPKNVSPAMTKMPETPQKPDRRLLTRLLLTGEAQKAEEVARAPIRCVVTILKPAELCGLHRSSLMDRPLQLSDWERYWQDKGPLPINDQQKAQLQRLVQELRTALNASQGGFVALRPGGLWINVVETDCGEDYSEPQMAAKLKLLEVYEFMHEHNLASVVHCKSGVGRSYETYLASQVLSELKTKKANSFSGEPADYYDLAEGVHHKIKALRPGVVAGDRSENLEDGHINKHTYQAILQQKRLRNVVRIVGEYVEAHARDFPSVKTKENFMARKRARSDEMTSPQKSSPFWQARQTCRQRHQPTCYVGGGYTRF